MQFFTHEELVGIYVIMHFQFSETSCTALHRNCDIFNLFAINAIVSSFTVVIPREQITKYQVSFIYYLRVPKILIQCKFRSLCASTLPGLFKNSFEIMLFRSTYRYLVILRVYTKHCPLLLIQRNDTFGSALFSGDL